ncbi:MAG: division/cell wall cluster transcriptional repressor MraZ [Candidatus Competibacteraceae bacterium]|nr:division/cell wall cluster transcriptional repressor MraZ [Candidatus Competibacteraceae bacterium]
MFRGIHRLSLDNKGRLSIPAAYRQRLLEASEGRMVLTIDRDRCLLLYPLEVWEEIERQLLRLSSTNKRARALKRLLMGHAEDCEIDSGGRILLPGPLRGFAALEKRVVLVGQGNKFEIWNDSAWQAWCEAALDGENDDGEPMPDLDALAF